MKNTNPLEENEGAKHEIPLVDSSEVQAPSNDPVLDRRTFVRGSLAAAAASLLGNSASASMITTGAPDSLILTSGPTAKTWESTAKDRIKIIEDKYVKTMNIQTNVVEMIRIEVPELHSALSILQMHYEKMKGDLEALAKNLDETSPKFDLTYTTEANALEALAKDIYSLSEWRVTLYEIGGKRFITGAARAQVHKEFAAKKEKAGKKATDLLVYYGLQGAELTKETAKSLNKERDENLLPAWDPAVIALANKNPRYNEFLKEYPNADGVITKMEEGVKAYEKEIEKEAIALDNARTRKEPWSLWAKRQKMIPMWRSLSRMYTLRGEAVTAYIHYKNDEKNATKKAAWENAKKSFEYKLKDIEKNLK